MGKLEGAEEIPCFLSNEQVRGSVSDCGFDQHAILDYATFEFDGGKTI